MALAELEQSKITSHLPPIQKSTTGKIRHASFDRCLRCSVWYQFFCVFLLVVTLQSLCYQFLCFLSVVTCAFELSNPLGNFEKPGVYVFAIFAYIVESLALVVLASSNKNDSSGPSGFYAVFSCTFVLFGVSTSQYSSERSPVSENIIQQ